MKKVFLAFGLLLLVGGAVLLQKIRAHGLSARAKPMAVEVWLARNVRSLATPSSVKTLKNPFTESALLLAEARDHFADHCAVCHGNRGDGKTMFGEGMFPPPPDLRKLETQNLTDGEIMNIIKEGIRFTGMPGFGGSDEDNWKLVPFIRHLPHLTEKEVQMMSEVNHMDEEEGLKHDGH